uniref:Uncharacterized protein n=1 Tax=Arundo donax TaxID=35708 RepID=A0A0A9HBP1_ARUDO
MASNDAGDRITETKDLLFNFLSLFLLEVLHQHACSQVTDRSTVIFLFHRRYPAKLFVSTGH